MSRVVNKMLKYSLMGILLTLASSCLAHTPYAVKMRNSFKDAKQAGAGASLFWGMSPETEQYKAKLTNGQQTFIGIKSNYLYVGVNSTLGFCNKQIQRGTCSFKYDFLSHYSRKFKVTGSEVTITIKYRDGKFTCTFEGLTPVN